MLKTLLLKKEFKSQKIFPPSLTNFKKCAKLIILIQDFHVQTQLFHINFSESTIHCVCLYVCLFIISYLTLTYDISLRQFPIYLTQLHVTKRLSKVKHVTNRLSS